MPFSVEERTERRQAHSELRMADDGYLEGYAAVFNEWSVDLGGFTERILPGAFPADLRTDVRALFNHVPSLIVARSINNSTLTIREDDAGLYVRFRPADTQAGRDLVTLVRGGEIDQMSFKFWVPEDGDRWFQLGGKLHRELIRVGVLDVSAATFPAYLGTSIYARSMVDELSRQDPNHVYDMDRGYTHNQAEDDQGIDPAAEDPDLAGQVAMRAREIELVTVNIRA